LKDQSYPWAFTIGKCGYIIMHSHESTMIHVKFLNIRIKFCGRFEVLDNPLIYSISVLNNDILYGHWLIENGLLVPQITRDDDLSHVYFEFMMTTVSK